MGLHLVIEALAQMCTPEKIAWVASHHQGCTVAIGLEAYEDKVLRFHVNKGFTARQRHKAVENVEEKQHRGQT